MQGAQKWVQIWWNIIHVLYWEYDDLLAKKKKGKTSKTYSFNKGGKARFGVL